MIIYQTHPNFNWSDPANIAHTVHLASLQLLFFSSVAKTAPRWLSNLALQSTPPEHCKDGTEKMSWGVAFCIHFLRISRDKTQEAGLVKKNLLLYVTIAEWLTRLSHSFKALMFIICISPVGPKKAASCSHLTNKSMSFPKLHFRYLNKEEKQLNIIYWWLNNEHCHIFVILMFKGCIRLIN